MSLHLVSRLSSLGREIYERLVHRVESAHPTAPLAVSDSEPTQRFARAAEDSPSTAEGPPPDQDSAPPGDDDLVAERDGSEAEIAQDLQGLDIEQLAYGEDAQSMPEPDVRAKDAGDLYGVWIAPASDRAHRDDDAAFDDGQNWVESLQTDAAEGGPVPEQAVDIVDDEDLRSPPSDAKDRPVADRGSAGPRGL